jgi:hypothetical protein
MGSLPIDLTGFHEAILSGLIDCYSTYVQNVSKVSLFDHVDPAHPRAQDFGNNN